jgi:selenocysteine-specific elongation factor
MRSLAMDEGSARPLTLGTAGHIDHGKTALVEALTGKNTDRLSEEHRRGISIELGFAELRLPNGQTLSVVDVPGHERFVRTMVAGATGIDLFLMVIAADDGVMPQTREHWAILRALGIERGVIALTKCDLADRSGREAAARGALALMPDIPLTPVSALTGHGLGELRRALAEAASTASASGRACADWLSAGALLHVDRVFSLRGIGTVVTGTLWSGNIRRGEWVEVLPLGKAARVRSVQVHDRDLERAAAGQRVALNLAGVERSHIHRGDVVLRRGSRLRPTYRLDVELWLEAPPASFNAKRVQVHHGTRDAAARVVALDEAGELAQLRLEAPLIARPGDRFVIRGIARPDTLGGGLVLDAGPARHGGGEAVERLRLIRDGQPEELLAAALAETETGLPDSPEDWDTTSLLRPSLRRFSRARWLEAAESRVEGHDAVREGGRLMAPERRPPWPTPSRIAESARAGQPEPGAAAARALRLLGEDGVEPRAPQALADSLGIERREALSLLEELVSLGRAVRLKPHVFYPRPELDRLTGEIIDMISRRGGITLAELRDALGTSRKYAQALLEHLDATQRTVRLGDQHVLRRHRRSAGAGGSTLAAGRQGSGGPPGLQS